MEALKRLKTLASNSDIDADIKKIVEKGFGSGNVRIDGDSDYTVTIYTKDMKKAGDVQNIGEKLVKAINGSKFNARVSTEALYYTLFK